MIYRKFQDLDISMLGFGLMRLPQNEDKTIDEKRTAEMVDYAIRHGINYFDTAWPYLAGTSETVIGKILKNYPRESFYIADKFPGHMIYDSYEPAPIFEKQLEKCGVDYFDFYLLHNVYENSVSVYEDPKWGIMDYFLEQKKNGRIKHLGFSTHGEMDCIKYFMEKYGEHMEFCQLQLNYLDWSVQKASEKYEYMKSLGIPVVVMEPVRGGKLAELPEDKAELLAAAGRGGTGASYALRWTQKLDNVFTVLSGMSSLEQMKDNVASFGAEPLNEEEEKIILEIAEEMKNYVPCTACGYCAESCPAGLDIPQLMYLYNQLKTGEGVSVKMKLDAFGEGKLPSACVACGACQEVCPQKIAVPDELAAFTEELKKVPSWKEICRKRAEEAKAAEKRSS